MVTLSALEAQRLLVALDTAESWVDPCTEEQRAWARTVRQELAACRRVLRRAQRAAGRRRAA